jgi:hypothetical protein
VNGDGVIDINDVLEILKLLAGLPNVIETVNERCGFALYAALVPQLNSPLSGFSNVAPAITDALEILRYLAGLPSGACRHDWIDEEIIQPTCTEPGRIYSICGKNNCRIRNSSREAEEADLLKESGHFRITVTTPATCTQEGSMIVSCSRDGCEHVFTNMPLSMGGHICNGGVVTRYATCAVEGKIEYHCTQCNTLLDTELIPRHDYNDFGVCTVRECGHIRDAQPGHFQYFMYRDITPFSNHIAWYYQDPCYGETQTHWGIDIWDGIWAPAGSIRGNPIYAQGVGRVLHVNCEGVPGLIPDTFCRVRGWFVVIQYGDYTVRYLHLERPSELRIGDSVTHTTTVGITGNSAAQATSHGHLHFDVNTMTNPRRWDSNFFTSGNTIDPEDLFPRGLFIHRFHCSRHVCPDIHNCAGNSCQSRCPIDHKRN